MKLLKHFFNILISIILLFVQIGCTNQKSDEFKQALDLYKQNKLEKALPLFENLVSNHKSDAEILAWLAETYRRLGEKIKTLQTAEQALNLDTCNSFAHTVIATVCNKQPYDELLNSDTTWIHINKAVQCNPEDGNAWVFMCGEAMLREKYDLMQKSAQKMKESGFLTESILAYARWMMHTLPDSAILITNGDMDTFPPLALQAAEGFRTDIAIVEKQWLGLKQYHRYLRDHYQVYLPLKESEINSMVKNREFPDNMLHIADNVFRGWIEQKKRGTLSRPLALAVTVYEDFYKEEMHSLQYCGPYLLWKPELHYSVPDTTAIRKSFTDIKIKNFSGPWACPQDHSPIRLLYTKNLAWNITHSALVLSELMIKDEKYKETERILKKAEAFERKTELGPVESEQIQELRSRIQLTD